MIPKSKAKKFGVTVLLAALTFMPFAIEENTSLVGASNESTNILLSTASEKTIKNDKQLHKEIDAILNDGQLEGAVTGVSIRKASNGELLYSHDGDIRLHPASNQKLLTAAAALDTLGPDYQFTTDILTDGTVKGKVLHGNLYIRGQGDPTLLKKDLVAFAKELKEKGIQKIKGDLIGDDSWFDDVRLSTDLNWDDEAYYTGAQISALTLSPNDDYDSGTIIVEVHPGKKAGDRPIVKLEPETDYVQIINQAKTTGTNEANTISVERQHGSNEIVIEGNIPLNGSRSRAWSSVWEPSGYVLDVFKQALEEQGIRQIGNTGSKLGVTPTSATVLATNQSMSLKELLIPFMKLSNNGHGEILAKTMGKVVHGEGSWEKGINVIESTLARYDLDMQTIQIRDGSGMSHKNYIPTNELTKLLYAVQNESWFPVLEQSLPVAGMSDRLVGGTLRNRMIGESTSGNVKAKTGSLTGVNTLSGYVTAADGEQLIFSIMMNNYITGPVTQIQDQIATILAEHKFVHE